MDRSKATQIASYAGQAIAIMMFGFGVMRSRPTLTLIGVFIFFAARQENKALQRQTWLNKTKASDIMDPIEHVFHSGQSMTDAKEKMKDLKGDSFIVWSRPDVPVGYITRDSLTNFNSMIISDGTIDAWVIPSPAVVAPETPAGQLFSFMQHYKLPLALVFDKVNYQGIVHWKKLAEGAGNNG